MTIVNADCVDYMRDSMHPDSIDLTVTSPPYDDLRNYEGYKFDFEEIAKQLYRVTKPGGVVVWVVADKTKDGNESGTSFRQALYFKETGFNLFDTMIYQKPTTQKGSNMAYISVFEYMFVFSKGVPKTTNLIRDRKNKYPEPNPRNITKRVRDGQLVVERRQGNGEYGRRTNIWYIVSGGGHSTKDKFAYEHPAIFPEQLAADHIVSWSNPGDLVFDPMCGSGTTCKMAMSLNRKFIGVDISQKYCEIARRRTAAPMGEFLAK